MRRKGLSYLEVLIAAGIALTGILGAIALFPVAILNMQKGQVVDVAAAIGPGALDDIPSYGIDDSSKWMFWTGSAWYEVERQYSFPLTNTTEPANPAYAPRSDVGNRPWHSAIGAGESFCFDPRFASELTTYDATQFTPSVFPYTPINGAQAIRDVRMRRLTLASGQFRHMPAPDNRAILPPPPMSVQQSRLLFKVPDDLLFHRESDTAGPLPARQDYIQGSTGNQRRNFYADYEFVYTATPHTDVQGSTINNSGSYDVAAVVFYKRQARLDEILSTVSNEPEAERLVEVASMPTSGMGGGDVLIQTRANRPAADLELHDGDYVMLSAMTYSPPGVLPLSPASAFNPPPAGQFFPTGPLFRWYRVAAVQGEAFQNGASWQRWVTLDGADWPVALGGMNTTPVPTQVTADNGIVTTRMTIVSGVVGVFHGTMRLP